MTTDQLPGEGFQPCFDNMLAVLRREQSPRPVLYEIFLNWDVYQWASGMCMEGASREEQIAIVIKAFRNLGYDYANPWNLYDFALPKGEKHKERSISLNEAPTITDRASFDAYQWPNPDDAYFVPDEYLCSVLPDGMKLIPLGPGGVLENAIGLIGYDNLCYMLVDDRELVQMIFDHIGERLLKLYQRLLPYESVGAIVSNDDWGFKTQTMLSVRDMRQYVFPWHKKIVAAAHAAGKPVILHSCGNPAEIMEDVIEMMKFDGRHSYEDTIIPVEQAYDCWGDRIAAMGGIDVNYLCTKTPAEVHARAKAMLERTQCRSYALGSGNSIPDYVPRESYLAMISAAWAA